MAACHVDASTLHTFWGKELLLLLLLFLFVVRKCRHSHYYNYYVDVHRASASAAASALRLQLLHGRQLLQPVCIFAVQRAVAGVSSPCLLRLDLSLPFSPSLCLYRVTCRVHFGPSPTCVLCVHCCATRRIRILRIRIRILVNIMANYAQFRGCSFH